MIITTEELFEVALRYIMNHESDTAKVKDFLNEMQLRIRDIDDNKWEYLRDHFEITKCKYCLKRIVGANICSNCKSIYGNEKLLSTTKMIADGLNLISCWFDWFNESIQSIAHGVTSTDLFLKQMIIIRSCITIIDLWARSVEMDQNEEQDQIDTYSGEPILKVTKKLKKQFIENIDDYIASTKHIKSKFGINIKRLQGYVNEQLFFLDDIKTTYLSFIEDIIEKFTKN